MKPALQSTKIIIMATVPLSLDGWLNGIDIMGS